MEKYFNNFENIYNNNFNTEELEDLFKKIIININNKENLNLDPNEFTYDYYYGYDDKIISLEDKFNFHIKNIFLIEFGKMPKKYKKYLI